MLHTAYWEVVLGGRDGEAERRVEERPEAVGERELQLDGLARGYGYTRSHAKEVEGRHARSVCQRLHGQEVGGRLCIYLNVLHYVLLDRAVTG